MQTSFLFFRRRYLRVCCDQEYSSSFCPRESLREFFSLAKVAGPCYTPHLFGAVYFSWRLGLYVTIPVVGSAAFALTALRFARRPLSTLRPLDTNCLLPAPSSGRARDLVSAMMSSGGIAAPGWDRSNPSNPAYETSANLRGAATPAALHLAGAMMTHLAVAINLTGALQLGISQLNFDDGPDRILKSWTASTRRILRISARIEARPRGAEAPTRTSGNFAPNSDWPLYALRDI